MGCNCNNGCNATCNNEPRVVMQTGDTFPLYMTLKEGDTVIALDEGQELLVGIYDKAKKLLVRGGTDDGRVTYQDGVYVMTVTHGESLLLTNIAFVELSIASDEGNAVYHGDKVIPIRLEPRNNNGLFDGETPVPIPNRNTIITNEEIDEITT